MLEFLGFRDWNVLAARIQSTDTPTTSVQANSPTSTEEKIPLVPMRDMVLFPHMVSRIFVARDKTRQAVEHALAGDRRVVVVAQRSGTDDRPSTADALHSIGVIANVVDRQTQVDGALKVTVCGLQRTGIVRVTDGEFLAAEVKVIEEQGRQSKEAGALSSAVLNAYQTYADVDFSALPPGSKRDSACLRSAIRASWPIQLPPYYRPVSSKSSSSWRPVTWWLD